MPREMFIPTLVSRYHFVFELRPYVEDVDGHWSDKWMDDLMSKADSAAC